MLWKRKLFINKNRTHNEHNLFAIFRKAILVIIFKYIVTGTVLRLFFVSKICRREPIAIKNFFLNTKFYQKCPQNCFALGKIALQKLFINLFRAINAAQ